MLSTDQWRQLVQVIAFLAKVVAEAVKTDEAAGIAQQADALKQSLGVVDFKLPNKQE